MIPQSWFTQTSKSSIWVTGYLVIVVPGEHFASGPKIMDLNLIRAILLNGTVKYLDSSQTKTEIIGNKIHFKTKVDENETAEGVYLLLITPFGVDGSPGNEAATRERISVASGLLAAFNGHNMIYQRLFDNSVHLGDGKVSTYSPIFINPLSFPPPNLSDSYLNTISEADKHITALAEHDRNRVLLSLRWFESAVYEKGVDAFLKYWIALETLAMPDTTNIRSLNEILSKAYGLPLEKATSCFCIGRLHGLRSRMVHEGQIVPIHQNLLSYTEALYVDILFDLLGQTCERRAENVSNKPGFKLTEYLYES